MQWPPTRPGRKPSAFHLVFMPSMTSAVSMPMRSKTMASSFMKAMLISRWLFSTTLTASAVLIVETGQVPTSMTMS